VYEDWGEVSERWAGVRSEVVDVRRTQVHTLRAGDEADGTPQLFVHGLGGAASNWIEVLARFADHGPVLAPDLPGFGRTEPPVPGASRIRANARFLRTLLDTVGWDRVIVHGNSMGGLLSVLFAEVAPGRIERLVLAAPALPTRRRELRQLDLTTFQRFAPFMLPGVGTAVMRRMWATMTPEELWEDQLDYIHGDPSRLSPEIRRIGIANLTYGRETPWRLPGFVAAAESLVSLLLTGSEIRAAVDAVTAPTLLVWGSADRLVGRPVIDATMQQRPDWSLEVLETVGHAPMVEAPDRYVAAVRSWAGWDDEDREPARSA
jgi:pimeloyl-ACP methyl ester carboxylesterase